VSIDLFIGRCIYFRKLQKVFISYIPAFVHSCAKKENLINVKFKLLVCFYKELELSSLMLKICRWKFDWNC